MRWIVASSNRSVLYSTDPTSPPGCSWNCRVRSKFAVLPAKSTGCACSPANSGNAPWLFCNSTMTSNSGLRLTSRSVRRASTSRSKGTSSCAKASSTVFFAAASSPVKVSALSTSDLITTVLTKKPTSSFSSARLRPEVTVPSATSR